MRETLSIVTVTMLCACGGGGGGGTGGESGGWVHFQELKTQVPQQIQQLNLLRAHADRDFSTPYLRLVDPQGITKGDVLVRGIMGMRDLVAEVHVSDELPVGRYQGKLTVRLCETSDCSAELVGPFSLPYDVEVVPRRQVRKLEALPSAVAFTSLPSSSESRLTQVIDVHDNLAQPSAWTASSDQSWLTVSPQSGDTASPLQLTADPAHLASDTFYRATVTITPADSSVQGTRISVGLWVGTSDATSGTLDTVACVTAPVMGPCRFAATDPTGPFVYTAIGGTSVDVHNLYTGARETIASVGTQLGAMAVSPDGTKLYVLDAGANRMRVVDLLTRTTVPGWAIGAVGAYTAPLVIRPNGVDVVLVNDGNAYRASDGLVLSSDTGLTENLGASLNGTTIFSLNRGISPATMRQYFVDYSDFQGGSFQVSRLRSASPCTNGLDVASNVDGSAAFLACGAPYTILRADVPSLSVTELEGGAAFPATVERASDGRIFGVTGGQGLMDRLLVYDHAGGLQTFVDLNWGGGTPRLAVSGDGRIAVFPLNGWLSTIVVGN